MTHAVAQTQVFEFWTVYTKMYFESILQNNRFWTNYLADRCDFLKNFTTALVIRLSSEDSCSHRICRTCRICRQTGGLPSLQWQEGAISAQKKSSTFSETRDGFSKLEAGGRQPLSSHRHVSTLKCWESESTRIDQLSVCLILSFCVHSPFVSWWLRFSSWNSE